MSTEAWIGLIIVVIFAIYFKFGVSPLSMAKDAQKHKNRNDLTKTIFQLAQQQGGFWRIDFNKAGQEFTGFIIFSQNNTQKYYSFNELGYSNINPFTNHEFLKTLKAETEKRGGYYYPVTRTSAGWTGSISSSDGGQSYHVDYDSVQSIEEIHLYSNAYYLRYKPYTTNTNKINRYKNV